MNCNVSLLPPSYETGTFEKDGLQWTEEVLAKADARLMLKPGEQRYLAFSSRPITPLMSEYKDIPLPDLLESVHPSQEFPKDICTHNALEGRQRAKVNPKHALQQASLVGHLERRGLLDKKYALLEFGAGKGELSVYVHAALDSGSKDASDIFLIDRKNFRMKFKAEADDSQDRRNRSDTNKTQDKFQRIYIDIRDLDLSRIPQLQVTDAGSGETRLRPAVAYSKHLCGAATDLTIKCLENYQKSGGQVAGIAIALCCHQVCKYSMYVDHLYLSQAVPASSSCSSSWDDKQRSSFYHLTAMSSWAINAQRPPSQQGDGQALEAEHYSGLSFSQRAKAGHAIKRFLDIGRLRYVRRALHMHGAMLVYYTSPETSPENLALVAS
ncbi:tRNA:m4X modification enzyme [Dipsacomyces acuminosporus]|nr:tRNA:m4X modification enzyme [Dipsacomyces acuminosporus]